MTTATLPLAASSFETSVSSWARAGSGAGGELTHRASSDTRERLIKLLTELPPVPLTAPNSAQLYAMEGLLHALELEVADATERFSRVWEVSSKPTAWTAPRLKHWLLRTVCQFEKAQEIVEGQVGEVSYGLVESIRELSALPRGWDGNVAKQITQEAIDAAIELVEALSHKSLGLQAFADPEGGVGLEGRIGSIDALLSIASTNSLAYVLKHEGAVHRGNSVNINTFRALIDALT